MILKDDLEELLELFKEFKEDADLDIKYGDTRYFQGQSNAFQICYQKLLELLRDEGEE